MYFYPIIYLLCSFSYGVCQLVVKQESQIKTICQVSSFDLDFMLALMLDDEEKEIGEFLW